jgi:hypothetical protein
MLGYMFLRTTILVSITRYYGIMKAVSDNYEPFLYLDAFKMADKIASVTAKIANMATNRAAKNKFVVKFRVFNAIRLVPITRFME